MRVVHVKRSSACCPLIQVVGCSRRKVRRACMDAGRLFCVAFALVSLCAFMQRGRIHRLPMPPQLLCPSPLPFSSWTPSGAQLIGCLSASSVLLSSLASGDTHSLWTLNMSAPRNRCTFLGLVDPPAPARPAKGIVVCETTL